MDFAKFRCRYLYFRALSEVDGKRWATVAEFTVRYERQTNSRQTTQFSNLPSERPKVDLHDFSGIKIFPVPFNDQLHIEGLTSRQAIRSIRLTGVDGITRRPRVSRMKNEANRVTVDTSKLPKGFYVLYFEEAGVAKKVSILKQ